MRPDGAPRRPDAAPPRPDGGRPAPLARDRTLFALIAIGLVSILVAAAILVAAPAPTPSALPTPSPSLPTASEGAFTFLATTFRDGVRVPIRWNPCQPIEYQIHLIDAPRGARTAIEGAIAGTSQATGLAFVSDGDTARTASQLEDRFFYADALHAVYRPVLITVVSHRTFRSLGAPARAVAFAHPEQGNQALDDQFVAGVVVVDGDVPYAHAGRWSLQLVVEHELGHLVGLAHVRDPAELMFSFEVAPHTIPDPIEGWGPGDLQGLERLGADQGCLERVRVAG